MGSSGAVLDIKEKDETSYCIPLWLRDLQVKQAIELPIPRVEPWPKGSVREEPIAVVGFGPSLNETWPRLKVFTKIITCSGAHKFLVERGVIPTYHCEVDPRAHKVDLIGEPHKDVEYFIASTCHADVFEHLKAFNTKLWHVFDSEADALRMLPHGEWALTGGCSVGLRAITIARFLGYVNVHIFGMDGNEGESGKHAAFHPMQPQKHNLTTYCDVYGCPEYGTVYKTTPGMLAPAKGLWHELDTMPDVKPVFYGQSLISHMARHYVPNHHVKAKGLIGYVKPLVITSAYRELNRKLHQQNLAYGVGGGKHADTVQKLITAIGAQSVLDYGCGKGLLAKALPFPIWEYDPAIPGKDESPKPADLVVCFPAGTLVSGAGNIEEIVPGQKVINELGVPQQVKKTYQNLFSGDLITLRVACVPDVQMTPEHPVLVAKVRRVHRKKGVHEPVASESVWKPAKEVAPGDWVSIPRHAVEEEAVLSFMHGRGHKWIERSLDEEIAWFIGLYVAEGFTIDDGKGRRVVQLALAADEEGLAKRAVSALDRLGVHGWINQSPSKRSMNGLAVMASSYGLPRRMDDWCGKGAASKKVPEFIINAKPAVVRSFIAGLVDGDGCLRADRRNNRRYESVTTVSRKLALGLLSLLHKLGIHASVSNPMPNRQHVQGRRVNALPVYVIQWSVRSVGKAAYGRGRFIGDRVYLPVIKKTEETVTNLPVFNIATDDETYGVPFTVHNCTDVLEHIEPECILSVLQDLKRVVKNIGYFTIHTGPARKTLPDGRNTHLIQQKRQWWKNRLKLYFTVGTMKEVGPEIHVIVGVKKT